MTGASGGKDAGSTVLELAAATVVVGAAPLGRTLAVHPDGGIRLAVLLLVVLAAAVVRSVRTARGWGVVRRIVAASVATAAVAAIGARPSPRLPDPGPLTPAIIGAWMAASVVLGLWVFGGRRWAVLPAFDPRSLAPVAVLTAVSGLLAQDQEQLAQAVAASVVAAAVALVVARRGDEVEEAQRAIAVRLGRLLPPGPPPLRAMAALGAVWWVSNLGIWLLGVLHSREVESHPWRALLASPRWFQMAYGLFSVVASVITFLLVGVLLVLHGRAVLPRIGRAVLLWTPAAVPLALLAHWFS